MHAWSLDVQLRSLRQPFPLLNHCSKETSIFSRYLPYVSNNLTLGAVVGFDVGSEP